MLGIYPPPKDHHQPFNVKNTFSLVSMTLVFISTLAYFLIEADSVAEYGSCFYSYITNLEFLAFFVVNFTKMQSILKLIEKLEEFIEKSEYFL